MGGLPQRIDRQGSERGLQSQTEMPFPRLPLGFFLQQVQAQLPQTFAIRDQPLLAPVRQELAFISDCL